MSEMIASQPIAETEENYEAAIEACWTELQHLRRQIDADQTEIDRLKTETRAMLSELKAMVCV